MAPKNPDRNAHKIFKYTNDKLSGCVGMAKPILTREDIAKIISSIIVGITVGIVTESLPGFFGGTLLTLMIVYIPWQKMKLPEIFGVIGVISVVVGILGRMFLFTERLLIGLFGCIMIILAIWLVR